MLSIRSMDNGNVLSKMSKTCILAIDTSKYTIINSKQINSGDNGKPVEKEQ